ncbi:GSCOCG00011494001-RA-CDS, partial [Cotesia congregata]
MKRQLSNSRTAVYKRNKKKVTDFLTAFPVGNGLPVPRSYFPTENTGLTENDRMVIDGSINDNNDIIVDVDREEENAAAGIDIEDISGIAEDVNVIINSEEQDYADHDDDDDDD